MTWWGMDDVEGPVGDPAVDDMLWKFGAEKEEDEEEEVDEEAEEDDEEDDDDGKEKDAKDDDEADEDDAFIMFASASDVAYVLSSCSSPFFNLCFDMDKSRNTRWVEGTGEDGEATASV